LAIRGMGTGWRGGEQRQSKQAAKTPLRGLPRLALAGLGVARTDYDAATGSGVTERPCGGSKQPADALAPLKCGREGEEEK
jgi:hypothetical protein